MNRRGFLATVNLRIGNGIGFMAKSYAIGREREKNGSLRPVTTPKRAVGMNEITLCVVNDGWNYQDRLAIARHKSQQARLCLWTKLVRLKVDELVRKFGSRLTEAHEQQAVLELDAYYQEHLKEVEEFDKLGI